MAERNYSHQKNLFDITRASKVTIIGVGSVGSYVAHFLDKAGVPELEIWDGDQVASHNTPMSLYEPEDVGLYKVSALKRRIRRARVSVRRKMYEGESLRNTVVVCCVDVMSGEKLGRKLIWESVKMVPSVPLFIDTRLSQWYVEVFAVDPCDHEEIEQYEKLLYHDSETVRQMCGRHGIIPVSVRAAQIAVSNLISFWQHGKKKWRHGERCDTFEVAF